METKEIAEEKAKEIELSYELPFCPITKGKCRKDCVCYEPALVIETSKGMKGNTIYSVNSPSCSNVVINGIVYVE